MHWWYKDIFIDRYTNSELEQRSGVRRIRFDNIKKAFSNANSNFQVWSRNRQQRRQVKKSHEQLNQLNDHYLADIGIRRIDLDSIAQGNYPGRFQQSIEPDVYARPLKLISAKQADRVDNSELDLNEHNLEKAA